MKTRYAVSLIRGQSYMATVVVVPADTAEDAQKRALEAARAGEIDEDAWSDVEFPGDRYLLDDTPWEFNDEDDDHVSFHITD